MGTVKCLTEPAGEKGQRPKVLFASSKRRKVEKASGGRLFVGNPRRGFPDRAVGSAEVFYKLA